MIAAIRVETPKAQGRPMIDPLAAEVLRDRTEKLLRAMRDSPSNCHDDGRMRRAAQAAADAVTAADGDPECYTGYVPATLTRHDGPAPF